MSPSLTTPVSRPRGSDGRTPDDDNSHTRASRGGLIPGSQFQLPRQQPEGSSHAKTVRSRQSGQSRGGWKTVQPSALPAVPAAPHPPGAMSPFPFRYIVRLHAAYLASILRTALVNPVACRRHSHAYKHADSRTTEHSPEYCPGVPQWVLEALGAMPS